VLATDYTSYTFSLLGYAAELSALLLEQAFAYLLPHLKQFSDTLPPKVQYYQSPQQKKDTRIFSSLGSYCTLNPKMPVYFFQL
jgi:hypothetical protein